MAKALVGGHPRVEFNKARQALLGMNRYWSTDTTCTTDLGRIIGYEYREREVATGER